MALARGDAASRSMRAKRVAVLIPSRRAHARLSLPDPFNVRDPQDEDEYGAWSLPHRRWLRLRCHMFAIGRPLNGDCVIVCMTF